MDLIKEFIVVKHDIPDGTLNEVKLVINNCNL